MFLKLKWFLAGAASLVLYYGISNIYERLANLERAVTYMLNHS